MSSDLEKELLDDFYAECDEHLSNARAQLARIEQASAKAHADREALQGLFRSMHSFKGISAIVGLRVAEELAHAAEEVLRAPSRSGILLPAEATDLLGRTIHRLEQMVAAHRLKQPLPEIRDLVQYLEALTAAPRESAEPVSDAHATGAEGPQVIAVTEPSRPIWRATFSPSAELDKRGININSVRARLASIGDITNAVPVIRPNGSMAFNFTIAARQAPHDLADWEANGISLEETDRVQVPPSDPAQPATPALEAPTSNLFIAPSHIVRVDLSRLDDLMRITGEMVIHRSRLEERIGRMSGDRSGLQEVNIAFARSLRELREALTRVRLVPVAEIFTRMPFVVRDLARDSGKKVRLVVEGQHTEIDKYLVERLKEPLLHLVRNAVSHGVEAAEARVAAGKPEEATLRLQASTSGHSVVIQISDDGGGIDARRIAARAAELGIEIPDTPNEAELLDVLCHPGFSTRTEADRAAGRGVGMAVVQNTVRELGGSLTLTTQPGAGTRFILRLPLTLSIAETFLVLAAEQTCAVPTGFVEEVLQFANDQVRTIHQAEVIPYRDGILPLVRLGRLFGATSPNPAQQPLLVLSSDRGLCGLVVDRVVGQREVVVRAMQDPLIQVPGVSGATELGDGRPVLILDAVALSSGAVRPRLLPRATSDEGPALHAASAADTSHVKVAS